MKSLQTRMLAIIGPGLLGICASASQATAQNTANGSFRLSHEILWQNAAIPAGEYAFATPSLAGSEPMLVRGPKGVVFQLLTVISDNHSDRPNALILERRGRLSSFARWN
jgi:hypothetical protein